MSCGVMVAVPLEGDALMESKSPRIVDKLTAAQTISEGDIVTFQCRFVSPVEPQVLCCRQLHLSNHRYCATCRQLSASSERKCANSLHHRCGLLLLMSQVAWSVCWAHA